MFSYAIFVVFACFTAVTTAAGGSRFPLSIVVGGRNDDYGVGFLHRIKVRSVPSFLIHVLW